MQKLKPSGEHFISVQAFVFQVLTEPDFLSYWIFMKRFNTNYENIVFMDQSGFLF